MKADTKHEDLIVILTEMHDRMMYLKEERLKQRFSRKRFKDACPLFFDQLAMIKASEWETFERRVAKRVKHHVPKSPEKKAKMFWRYKVVGEAKEIVQELVDSKHWQIEDLVKAGGHLDSIHMGLGGLRNNDEEWQSLFKMVRPYRTDPVLRELIANYISHSYAFCSVLLVTSYGNKLAKHDFGRMLYSALTSSNISPDRIEMALGEILEKISKRLKTLDERQLFYQSIAVKPITGKREADYERTEHTMWAELEVTNTEANELTHEWIVGGIKIDVEISSHEAVLWNGDFYIECHPNYLGGERAKFEFVEWDTWAKDKNITLLDIDR